GGTGRREAQYIYAQIPTAITSSGATAKAELRERYFADIKQLFMKLSMRIAPEDNSSTTEMIPMYADFDDYGMIAGTNNKIYIHIKPMESTHTPMVQYGFQFMKSFLPGKAYPGYDLSESGGLRAIISALASMFESFSELTKGEDGKFMADGKCQGTVTAK